MRIAIIAVIAGIIGCGCTITGVHMGDNVTSTQTGDGTIVVDQTSPLEAAADATVPVSVTP